MINHLSKTAQYSDTINMINDMIKKCAGNPHSQSNSDINCSMNVTIAHLKQTRDALTIQGNHYIRMIQNGGEKEVV